MARQLALDLARRPALGRADFFVAPANRAALAALDGWRDWPRGAMALCGPAAAGKTHLAGVWSAEAGAVLVDAGDLTPEAVPEVAAGGAVAVDAADGADPADPDAAPGLSAVAETALFHLHNDLMARGGRLLVVGRAPPARWPIRLPDLASRLGALPVARIEPPDDDLLRALLVKLFDDRGVTVGPDVVDYLLPRIERSFAGATDIVARLDAAALAAGKPLTRPFVARHLDPGDPMDDGGGYRPR